MPTRKKRVGFIPRENVMRIIDKLSFENNLSNSKIINILVEEALSQRGLFIKELGEQRNNYTNNSSFNSIFQVSNKPQNMKTVEYDEINKNNKKDFLSLQKNLDNFDIKTYEKFILFIKFQEMINKYEKKIGD